MAKSVVSKTGFGTADKNLEAFSLIWLDLNVYKTKDNQETQKKLRAAINYLKTFDDPDEFRNYIKQVTPGYYLVLIISGSLGQHEIPRIHHIPQISDIYVYCMDETLHNTWAKKFYKVKAVITELSVLVSQVTADQQNRLKLANFLSFEIFFFDKTKKDKSAVSLNGQFVHWQVLMDVLLRLKVTEKDKKELIDLCKTQYKGNDLELSILAEYEQSYSPTKALQWYTRECFLYKILNKAFRVQDIHILFLLRSFCRDIYQQLKENQCSHTIRVYRGQLVSKDELKTLQQSVNQLISMNSFLSTSVDPKQALLFSTGSSIPHDLERVLFEIEANPNNVASKPFANVSSHSPFKHEFEVLFMFGSIFRLNKIRQGSNGIWNIQVTLCSDQENDLKEVIEHMKNDYGNKKATLQLFGRVLWKMGKFDLAEKYYQRMIDELSPNDHLLVDLYDDLGQMAAMKGDLDASLNWKKKSLNIKAEAIQISAALPPRILVPSPTSKTGHASKNIYEDIERRITQIANSKQMPFNQVQIQKGSREERMLTVAWLLICKFDCKLYGGFIRDWVVGGYTAYPKNVPMDQWIVYNGSIPHLHPEIVPADLDCYLPTHGLSDVNEIVTELGKLQIAVRVHRDQWRYVLVIDQNTKTGPFIVDLITPHVGTIHYERIDFDVNNLYVEKDHTRHLGMRIDITQSPYDITLEKIVNNIKKRSYCLLAEINDEPAGKLVGERAKKMITRGWTQLTQTFIPVPPCVVAPAKAELTALSKTDNIYRQIEQRMRTCYAPDSVQVVSVEQIKNTALEAIYEEAKKFIQKDSAIANGNEMLLYHGTIGADIDQIADFGFDKKNYRQGNWGNGAYFSQNPKNEHSNTFPNLEKDNQRVLYQTKVLLGNVKQCSAPDINLTSAPHNYHSIHGIFTAQPNSDEFIIYRYGQALPHVKITYKV
ncbi:hypothetical protein I4U23_017229 [Adineta vaga]|nr:hypothetical protein I4U23_017229 [Adineta vaga]